MCFENFVMGVKDKNCWNYVPWDVDYCDEHSVCEVLSVRGGLSYIEDVHHPGDKCNEVQGELLIDGGYLGLELRAYAAHLCVKYNDLKHVKWNQKYHTDHHCVEV